MLFPSNAPTSDAVVRGEITVAALLYNAISQDCVTAHR